MDNKLDQLADYILSLLLANSDNNNINTKKEAA